MAAAPLQSLEMTRKLVAFFMRPDPPDAFVAALAADFAASDDDVRTLLRELFRSAEFYAPQSRAALFKSPVEFFVGTVRRLGIEAPPAPFPAFACEQLGQSLLEPPNVKGWDGGDDWISSSTILQRANVARTLVHGVDPKERRPERGGKDPLARIAAARARDWRPGTDASAMIGSATTASAAVAALCDRLLPVSPTRATVAELARYVAPFGDDAFDPSDVATRELLNDCVHLILSLPEYQLN